jgi:hypothetical protein
MFVLPCKYDYRSPIVESVNSIKSLHPDEKIVIVDSGSDDKSYYEKVDAKILDVSNPYRLLGALKNAYRKYPKEDYYILMHDSVCLKKSIQVFIDNLNQVKVFMHFSMPFYSLNNDIRSEYIFWKNQTLQMLDYPNKRNEYVSNDYISGVFGTMGIYSNDFVQLLDQKGVLDNVKAETFNHGQFSERLMGYICHCECIDIKDSIDGDAYLKWQDIENNNLEYMKKRLLSR